MSETEPSPTHAPRFVVSRAAVVLIALMWLVAGVTKVYSLPDFMDLIGQHGVIPETWRWLGMVLPFLELLIALVLVFVAGSELRKPFGRAVLVFSLAGIVGFTFYLSLVPDAVLQESGCGCLGPKPVMSGMETDVRMVAGIRTGLLIVLHIAALAGPVVTVRRLKKHGRVPG